MNATFEDVIKMKYLKVTLETDRENDKQECRRVCFLIEKILNENDIKVLQIYCHHVKIS